MILSARNEKQMPLTVPGHKDRDENCTAPARQKRNASRFLPTACPGCRYIHLLPYFAFLFCKKTDLLPVFRTPTLEAFMPPSWSLRHLSVECVSMFQIFFGIFRIFDAPRVGRCRLRFETLEFFSTRRVGMEFEFFNRQIRQHQQTTSNNHGSDRRSA